MEIKLTKENYQTTIDNGLVLVDFFATWCGPCKMLSPVIAEIAEESNGKYTVAKADVDELGDEAAALGIMSVPTIVLFKDGKEKDRIIGLRSKEDILQFIASELN